MLLAILAFALLPRESISSTAVEVQPVPVITHEKPVWNKTAIDKLIAQKAKQYNVDEVVMKKIVLRESTYIPSRVGDKNYICKKTGKVSPSYGLVQINLCWHNVTIEEAHDPEFAINFLAHKLSKGQCYLWSTCPLI